MGFLPVGRRICRRATSHREPLPLSHLDEMIGLLFALLGLACMVYAMFIVGVFFVSILAIAWKLLWATGLQLVSLFTRPRKVAPHTSRVRRGRARSTHPRSQATRGRDARGRSN